MYLNWVNTRLFRILTIECYKRVTSFSVVKFRFLYQAPVCDPKTTCNGQGTCQDDGTCKCTKGFLGKGCSSKYKFS